MKQLMCIAMLFVVACDSDSDSGGLTPTADNLQGTWDITNICFSGTFPDNDGCDDADDCIDPNDEYGFDQWVIIENNIITSCNNATGHDDCGYGEPDTFILSGNTITIFYSDGTDSDSATINLSSDGGTVVTVQSVTAEGCSATITQTWTKR